MPLRIVDHYPAVGILRRLGRALKFLLGFLLTLGGLACATYPLLLAVALLIALVVGESPSLEELKDDSHLFFLMTAGAVVGLLLGPRLIRGRRRLVLFLRRFGFVDSSEALTFAVGTAVGRRWRVVSLDDSQLAPVGVKEGVRRSFRWGRWLGPLLIAGAIFWGYQWYTSGEPERLADEAFHQVLDNAQGNVLQNCLGAVVAAVGAMMLAIVFFLGMVLVIVAFLTGATLFTWASHRSVRKAEQAKALSILAVADIAPATRRIERRSRRLFAPRLMVVRVAGEHWKEAVRALSASASAVLIDISEPTESLLWEVETLYELAGLRKVFVGRRDRLEALATATGAGPAARLARILDREEALAYASEERRDMKRFARSLGGRLYSLRRRRAG